MIHGPFSFFGLLPSRLPIVQGVFSCSRWANVQDEIPLALIDDYETCVLPSQLSVTVQSGFTE